jgi:hypothetical protein
MSTLFDAPHFRCANCEAAITGSATFFVGLAFCCAGCVAGGPCSCSYDDAPSAWPDRVQRLAGPAVTLEPDEEAAPSDEPTTVPVLRGVAHDLVSVA